MSVLIEDYIPVVKYEGLNTDKNVALGGNITVTGNLTVSGTTTIAAQTLTDLTTTGNTILGNAVSDTTSISGATTITSTSASALTVGRLGATTPVLKVDASTATVINGLGLVGSATTADVTLTVIGDTAVSGLAIAGKAGGAAGVLGGIVSITGGAGNTTGAGGDVSLVGGAGGNDAVGGSATLKGGAAGTGTGNRAGGAALVTGGAAQGTGAGGAVTLTSGAAENGTAVNPGASGAINLNVGAAGTATTGVGGAGGTITLLGAAGGVSTGASSTAGAGSGVVLTAGAGGASSGGTDTGGAGGSVTLTAGAGGTGTTAGKNGSIYHRATDGAGYFFKMPAPAAKTTNATLSVAEMLGGWITVDGSGSATSTQTTPSGTALAAEFPGLAAGDSFDFRIINISTDASETAILAFGADITGVGSMIVSDNATNSEHSSGTFRFRYSGANVWVAYRI